MEDDGLRVDLMPEIDGCPSFDWLCSGAAAIPLDGQPILTASLADIIRSKRAAGRPKDRAVLDILKITLDKKITPRAKTKQRALAREHEGCAVDLVRFRLSLPPEKRLNVLRRKVGLRATAL